MNFFLCAFHPIAGIVRRSVGGVPALITSLFFLSIVLSKGIRYSWLSSPVGSILSPSLLPPSFLPFSILNYHPQKIKKNPLILGAIFEYKNSPLLASALPQKKRTSPSPHIFFIFSQWEGLVLGVPSPNTLKDAGKMVSTVS